MPCYIHHTTATKVNTAKGQQLEQQSDFAQNLQVEKKHEVSEEYFHKTQFALFATVTTVVTEEEVETGDREKVQHTVSQATSYI